MLKPQIILSFSIKMDTQSRTLRLLPAIKRHSWIQIQIHRVVTCLRISFLFKGEWSSTVCIFHILFIHSSLDEHLDCCHPSDIVNNAAMKIGVQISVQVPAFNSSGNTSRSRICRPCGNFFNALTNCLPSCFPQWLRHLTFPWKLHKGFNLLV